MNSMCSQVHSSTVLCSRRASHGFVSGGRLDSKRTGGLAALGGTTSTEQKISI
jgi:hypothetical protein